MLDVDKRTRSCFCFKIRHVYISGSRYVIFFMNFVD
uniref:Uncharacterized protein n=1 Tax=Rhizophora mucronata TaxID=61149 RepID=A0A2P2KV23_RHIMU